MYAENSWKTVIVINPKAEPGQLLNAVAHLSLGLPSHPEVVQKGEFLDYRFKSSLAPARISRYSLIVLESKNNNQLRTLHQAATDLKIPVNAFTDSMFRGSAAEQLEATLTTPIEQLTYLAVGLFGPAEVIQPLTKKFSLFKRSLTLVGGQNDGN